MKLQFLAGAAALASLTSASITLPRAGVTIQPDEKIKPGKFNGKPRCMYSLPTHQTNNANFDADLSWLADSEIKRGVAPISAYTASALYSGIMLAYNRTGDKKYLDFVKFQTDIILYPDWDGTIVLHNNSNSIDDIRIGHTFLDIYEATGNEIYVKAAQGLKDQIDRSFRTPAGGFYVCFSELFLHSSAVSGVPSPDMSQSLEPLLFCAKRTNADSEFLHKASFPSIYRSVRRD